MCVCFPGLIKECLQEGSDRKPTAGVVLAVASKGFQFMDIDVVHGSFIIHLMAMLSF